MPDLGDKELFDRSVATLVASWGYLASGSPGAEVVETDGAAIAAFTHPPEREHLNNTVLTGRAVNIAEALDEAERIYAGRGIGRFAIWVHESDDCAAAEVRSRGYRFDSSTRTMAMPIVELNDLDTPGLDLHEPSLEEFWTVAGVEGLVPELAVEGGYFYAARLGGESVATLMAFDHDGDCGIYMVGTQPGARRRGFATALSAHCVLKAGERGCASVSLQATEIAESIYAKVGFRDLGRFDEYVPTRLSPTNPDRKEPK